MLSLFSFRNNTGDPLCCPVAKSFVFALMMNVFKTGLARILLLVVCLGLGVVVEKLQKKQKLYIAALGVAFITFSINEQL